jgi:hypothetical protein
MEPILSNIIWLLSSLETQFPWFYVAPLTLKWLQMVYWVGPKLSDGSSWVQHKSRFNNPWNSVFSNFTASLHIYSHWVKIATSKGLQPVVTCFCGWSIISRIFFKSKKGAFPANRNFWHKWNHFSGQKITIFPFQQIDS